MTHPSDLSRPIIEALYTEALLLADEVRAAFALGIADSAAGTDDALRLALSSEGLKATTRMMHVLAWLLNQRAYFSGDLTDGQLRKHGRLAVDRPSGDENLSLLEPATRELIQDTIRLYTRIARLDEAWGDGFEMQPEVRRLHDRIGRAMNGANTAG